MKILVLGGTGAMGIPLVKLLSEGNEVLVTSRSPHMADHSVRYVQGDAHEDSFLMELLEKESPFDVIIDFMIYSTEEFEKRLPHLLSRAGQYLFLSSSRVYAESQEPLTEASARLLDVSTNVEYLKTDEYALAKARQEDLLEQSGHQNWTVIRPYITYNTNRMQLGVFEKESWLYRALHRRTIVLPKDIAEKYTTLTYAGDVASVMAMLIGNQKALGQKFHITAPNCIKWNDVLNIYLDVLETETGIRVPAQYTDSSDWIRFVKRDFQAVTYDRLYHRRFDNAKTAAVCGKEHSFVGAETGLKMCLTEFLRQGAKFGKLHWKYEAFVDRMTGERTSLREIDGIQKKIRYIHTRYEFNKGI